ncbi:T9SS type A sorting domain-containing protein [Lacinutrix jangbogonensis]|uniref:T9SS type A sorting domain-containing protein n=1 Tax=Lacinutrix jangbogonensis TaxID=1469557 RepID=UPI000B0AB002|nr:T9SS type A sorting domain-containing protein [Lacinutrix jangbogonensis]
MIPGDPVETNPDLSNCNLLSINENPLDEASIKLSPNPVVDNLTIEYSKEIKSIEVYTLFGQLLKRVTNTKNIKFGKLVSGFYLVKISTDEGSFTKKILKD